MWEWWTRRSTMASTATASPKISAQAEKLLFEDTIRMFVAGGDELEEQRCGVGVEGDVAHFVDDEQRDPAQAFQLVGEVPGSLGMGEPEHPLGGGGERNR